MRKRAAQVCALALCISLISTRVAFERGPGGVWTLVFFASYLTMVVTLVAFVRLVPPRPAGPKDATDERIKPWRAMFLVGSGGLPLSLMFFLMSLMGPGPYAWPIGSRLDPFPIGFLVVAAAAFIAAVAGAIGLVRKGRA